MSTSPNLLLRRIPIVKRLLTLVFDVVFACSAEVAVSDGDQVAGHHAVHSSDLAALPVGLDHVRRHVLDETASRHDLVSLTESGSPEPARRLLRGLADD